MDERLTRDGFLWLRRVASESTIDRLCRAIDASHDTESIKPSRSLRNALRLPDLLEFSKTEGAEAVAGVVGVAVQPVRAIVFDKSAGANWGVGWHQDLVIAVAERAETPGFTAWSEKEGVVHVKPPAAVLRQMVTLRLHLDDCPEANGPLRVSPGSHRMGAIAEGDIAHLAANSRAVVCSANRGDALVMRPLLLHASSKSTGRGRRRVLHIEYSEAPLPGGLRWPRWS